MINTVILTQRHSLGHHRNTRQEASAAASVDSGVVTIGATTQLDLIKLLAETAKLKSISYAA